MCVCVCERERERERNREVGRERGSQTDQKIGRSCASASVYKKKQKKNEIRGKIQREKCRHTLLLPAKKQVFAGSKKEKNKQQKARSLMSISTQVFAEGPKNKCLQGKKKKK